VGCMRKRCLPAVTMKKPSRRAGATCTLAPSSQRMVPTCTARREGFFIVTAGKQRFRMHPTESRTGAIRLEDPKRGAMWLQLSNKSMLMSQKLGQRLADECQSPDQMAVAEAMKSMPPVNILEPARPATRP
jgi:hypothetical protein